MTKKHMGIALAICLVCAAIIIGAVLLLRPQAKDHTTTPVAQGSGPIAEDIDTATTIDTPYGALQYPVAFAQTLNVRQEASGEAGLAVSFESTVTDQPTLLFTVHFDDGLGSPIGTLTIDDGKTVTVGLEMKELSADGLSQEQSERLYAMQEGVNVTLGALTSRADFTPAG